MLKLILRKLLTITQSANVKCLFYCLSKTTMTNFKSYYTTMNNLTGFYNLLSGTIAAPITFATELSALIINY